MRRALRRLGGAALLAVPLVLAAAEPGEAGSPWRGRVPVAEAALQGVRGGFTGPDGSLQLAFGVERSVYLNGSLAGSVAGGQALLLVQNGLGNVAATQATATAGTLIQNSVDGAQLQAVSVLDVTVNSLRLTKSIELQRSVTAAIAASLRR